MRALLVFVLLLLPAAPAAATEVQRIGKGLPRDAPAALSEDGSAVAYVTGRGIVLRRLRADGRFGRPRLVASRARGGRADGPIGVATRGRRAVVAWIRNDRTQIEEPEARIEGCCDRLHAVIVGARGRPGRPQRLSPPGRSVSLGPLVVGPRSVIVSWHSVYGDWTVRVHARGGWLRRQPISGGSPGDLRYVGGRLLAVAAEEAGNAIRVVMRGVGGRGRTHSPRRVATFRGILDGVDLRIDRYGGTTGVVDIGTYRRSNDGLIAGGRAGRAGVRVGEYPRAATAASGASAVLAVRSYRRASTARIRRRTAGAASFGGWSRVRIAHTRARIDNTGIAVRDDGRAAIGTLYSAGGRLILSVTEVPWGGHRRLRSYRHASMKGVLYDRLGRLTLLVGSGSKLEIVRP